MTLVYTRALHTLQSLPGVLSAGMVHAVPMGGAPDSTGIRVPGRTPKQNEQPYANYMFTSPGYFASVRTPLLRGRDFSDSDTLASMPVTIVNKTMANALWPRQQAVGKQVGVQLTKYPVRTVIGVVADVKQNSLREETAPQMYVPFTQNEIKIWPSERTMQVALRAVGDPTTMTGSIREAMKSVDPDLPLAKVAKLSSLVESSLTQARFSVLLLAPFGVLSVVLASVGMYGVISHSVTQRTREIGIRMALGAERATVFSMVLEQGPPLGRYGDGDWSNGRIRRHACLVEFSLRRSPVRSADFRQRLRIAHSWGSVCLLDARTPRYAPRSHAGFTRGLNSNTTCFWPSRW